VSARAAVFLDRDGVLIEDVDAIVRPSDILVLDGVAGALSRLAGAGYALVVVTNQTVISRGLASEEELGRVHGAMLARLGEAGAPHLDGIYVCPHHPSATVPAYRVDCECRKPRPGLLVRAASDLALDLSHSTMVGDRVSDVVAGALAGCSTVLVRSGAHDEPMIESSLELAEVPVPDYVCADLEEAADWILERK
jgi:D-glycero-D-manno-heptose 1,7-bisphosphate phosphatase